MPESEHFFLHEEDQSVDLSLFNPDALSKTDKVTKSLRVGRGKVIFFRHQGYSLVLRHYRRGGLPARISADRYIWTGLENTRAWREYRLLKQLEQAELPAPKVFAAHVEKRGIFYRADLVTQAIEGAESMTNLLLQGPLDEGLLMKVGETIRSFHDANVNHTDLNASNILIDQSNAVYLIDFDRCSEQSGTHWKATNLGRLLRSLRKLQNDSLSNRQNFHFSDQNWAAICDGYERT